MTGEVLVLLLRQARFEFTVPMRFIPLRKDSTNLRGPCRMGKPLSLLSEEREAGVLDSTYRGVLR